MAKTKEQRFHEVAASRTNRVLEDIRVLSNCSNKNNYEYTEEEAQQIFRAIESSLKECKALFLPTSRKKSLFVFEDKGDKK